MTAVKPASFDSASVAASSVTAFLSGYELPPLGIRGAAALRPLLAAANRLPADARRWLYAAASGAEGQPARVVSRARWKDLSERIVSEYPQPRHPGYPGAVIGSAPGAAVHLCAALGMPLLPQTQLIPLRRRSAEPDDPWRELRAGAATGRALLDNEPDLALQHMIDPNEDRLTLRWFSYFRVKATRLGPAYERFLRETLRPGATLVVLDCRETWPVTRLGERQFFQFGGVGGASLEEYFHGGPRVWDFLRAAGVTGRTRWDPPEPDTWRPEAEWGFDTALADDVQRFAAENGYRVVRLSFDHADSLSPLVADLYRWWYADLGRPASRLFVQSFALVAPMLTLRAGAVPYWLSFSDRGSVDGLVRYLDGSEPFDEIALTLMAHGTDSIGLSTTADWERVLGRARTVGRLAGVDPRRFPADFGVFLRYRDVLRRVASYPLPHPLPVERLAAFLERRRGDYPVEYSVEAG